MKISGAQLFVQALKMEKVDTLFGYPGGVVIPIFDELYRENSIRVILTRHEQAAVHAADGYARSTGKPGVCLVTSGPGATNTITGLATANFDSVPVICFSGQVITDLIGNDAFQEADMVGLTRSVTKHNYIVYNRADLPRILKEAFIISTTGRPGPVVVDLPKDILVAELEDSYPDTVQIRGYNPVVNGHNGQIKKAAQELTKAKQPLFYIGGGVQIANAAKIFNELAEKTQIPVVASLMGIGAIRSDHPLFLGMLGMHGTYAANMAVTECDLLFAIGSRFDDRATGNLQLFAPHAEIVHIDIDPASISRNVTVQIPVVGDAKSVLKELLPMVKRSTAAGWLKQVQQWKTDHPVTMTASGERLSPTRVIKAISDFFPDAIICTEVGQHQMWTAQFYNFTRPRTLLTSGGLGTMGYGFPAAIGAQLACPDQRVIDIAGDGSIQMNIQEMSTAVNERLPIIIAILNNGYLGMVRQWQEMFYERRYSSTCLAGNADCPRPCASPGRDCPRSVPDFVKLADAYGAYGLRIEREDQIAGALEAAKQTTDRPIILDFQVEREANVLPMVPAGAGIAQMILE